MAIQSISTTVNVQADTAADLSTAQLNDVRLSDGYRVWVVAAGVTHGLWTLDQTSVAAIDGTSVVATFSGVGRWVRLGSGGGGTVAPEPMRFDLVGNPTSDFFLGNQAQASTHAAISRPIAVAATYTKMRVKLAVPIGIGNNAIFTVTSRTGATAITGTLTAGQVDVTFTFAGVLFAAIDSMSVQVHFDQGTVTGPEVVVF